MASILIDGLTRAVVLVNILELRKKQKHPLLALVTRVIGQMNDELIPINGVERAYYAPALFVNFSKIFRR
ncbi:hypothetical protein DAY22_00715 [Lactiplantibacillus plantarum]|nr:hypothetical protein A9F05_05805 [Lactiplantibacillus plantarum]KAF1285680.1 hypothetical protein CHF38_00715 [Lactiplantibacillus plantarum]RAH98610.1 hypothetical protein DAY22_00715 [Lactiplantibacillus plantarum]